MADYTNDIIRIIKKYKCTFVRRGKGDHNIWYTPILNRTFTVDSAVKDRHLANKILKDAGINYRF